MENSLEKSIELAKKYHDGQVDKGGSPYYLHLLAVMNRLDNTEEKIVGVLHDIVEDTDVEFEDLKKLGYPEHIIEAINSVTKRENESRAEFLYRASLNKIGRKVKIADLKENSDLSRIQNPSEKDKRRTENYLREISILSDEGWVCEKGKWKRTNKTKK